MVVAGVKQKKPTATACFNRAFRQLGYFTCTRSTLMEGDSIASTRLGQRQLI